MVNEGKLISAIRFLYELYSAKGKKPPKTHIHKILYFFEGFTFLMFGKPSLGIEFKKHLYGPMSPQVEKILKKPELFYTPHACEDLTALEVETLSIIFTSFYSKPAKYLSDITHRRYYSSKRFGEKMSPLGVLEFFVRKPTKGDIEWAEEELRAFRKGEKSPTLIELEEKLRCIDTTRSLKQKDS